jgi:hypothetical protein
MPAPSVTYTFANSTTADAGQVNTNFTDLINGMSDGTKDFSINALTVGGTATLNGNINLGSSTSDDLTVSASLASTINIKTTFSYDIGSATLGLRSLYLGSNDSAARSIRLIAPAVPSASYTLTLPTGGGTAGYGMRTAGSGTLSFHAPNAMHTSNLALSVVMAANAVTIALKGVDGNDPSSTNPVDVAFRNATLTTGTPVLRTITSSLSTAISSGSTGGSRSTFMSRIYIYLIDNAGTPELAWSGSNIFDENSVVSTTAEGAGGAADSGVTMYSTTARSNLAFRYIGFFESTQSTAGTWASAASKIGLYTESFPKNIAEYKFRTASTYGSTNDNSYIFSNADVSTDASGLLEIPNSATLGSPVFANRRCRVTMVVTDNFGSASAYGITVNADLTSDLDVQSASSVLVKSRTSGSDQQTSATATRILNPGDYLNFHNNKNAGGATTANVQMYVFAEEI